MSVPTPPTIHSDAIFSYLKVNSKIVTDDILTQKLNINGLLQYVINKNDFPTAVNGVITLDDEKTYVILGTVDLEGDRIVGGTNSVLIGTSSETSNLTSTGLGVGVAMITSQYTIIFKDITFHDVDTCLNLSGVGNVVIDWYATNFENIPNIGLIENYNNFIQSYSAILSSSGMIFDGTIGTIGFVNTIFVGTATATTVTISATCTLSRRFKAVECAFVNFSTSIDFSATATVPNQGYIIHRSNFSGPSSTFLSGVTYIDNKAFFDSNFGIENSSSVGGFYIDTPASTTLSLNDWAKISGTTTANPNNSKFSSTDNKLTYNGSLSETFFVTNSTALSGSNNNVIEIGVSLNGSDPTQDTVSVSTLDSGGKIGLQSSSFFIKLETDDYLEIYAKNTSGSNPITASQLTLNIIKL